MSSFRLIRVHLGSFEFIKPISLQLTKKNQKYQYLFYDYYLVHILATVWDTSTSILNSAVFLHTALDPLKQSRFDFTKLLSECYYLKSITEGLSFRIHLRHTQVKLLALSSHTTAHWKHQRCKCTMVYLKDSFIVSSSLFLFIHNHSCCDIDRRWGRKPISCKITVVLVPRNLESWYLPFPCLNYLTFYLVVLLQIMVLIPVQFRCPCILLTSYLLFDLVNHYTVCL